MFLRFLSLVKLFRPGWAFWGGAMGHQEPYHVASGHLGVGSLCHKLIPRFFTKCDCEESVSLCEVFLNAFRIFPGCQIDDETAFVPDGFIQPAPPQPIQILMARNRGLRLHFKPGRGHAVYESEHTLVTNS